MEFLRLQMAAGQVEADAGGVAGAPSGEIVVVSVAVVRLVIVGGGGIEGLLRGGEIRLLEGGAALVVHNVFKAVLRLCFCLLVGLGGRRIVALLIGGPACLEGFPCRSLVLWGGFDCLRNGRIGFGAICNLLCFNKSHRQKH